MITYGVINGLAYVRGISFTILDNTVWHMNELPFCGNEWHVQLPKYPEIIVQDYSPNCLMFPFFAGHLCEVAHGLAVMWWLDHFDRHSQMLIILN